MPLPVVEAVDAVDTVSEMGASCGKLRAGNGGDAGAGACRISRGRESAVMQSSGFTCWSSATSGFGFANLRQTDTIGVRLSLSASKASRDEPSAAKETSADGPGSSEACFLQSFAAGDQSVVPFERV